jgi:hypothetical protein
MKNCAYIEEKILLGTTDFKNVPPHHDFTISKLQTGIIRVREELV